LRRILTKTDGKIFTVACDRRPVCIHEQSRWNVFVKKGVLRGAALSDDGMEQAGMGIGVGDYDLDGHLICSQTHFADDANILYHNDGKQISRTLRDPRA